MTKARDAAAVARCVPSSRRRVVGALVAVAFALGAVGPAGATVAGGGQAVAPGAHAGCLALTAVPEGRVLATLAVGTVPTFDITYIHSVTRTPVVETYRVDHGGLLQTSIVFEQHGPGLPTEPDAGQTWTDRDGHFNVTLARRFDTIRMRVHRDQSPQLVIGSRRVDLAGWGNRAVELRAVSCADAAS